MKQEEIRHCRNCGRRIVCELRVYGRSSVRELWFVHVHSDRVPCDRGDVTEFRQRHR